MRHAGLMAVGLVAVLGLTGLHAGDQPALKIDYEKYKLPNGLEVILHEDKSDPIVAVAIFYHVGSNREEKGRTGFAHLFEHMLFQESQHVGQDQFFKKIQGVGGTLNGFTTHDYTGYFEIVPRNHLEMCLWLESDRMGYLLPTVTAAAFANQQDVVQNEKRQRVDNVPYGHTSYVIHKLLFPEDHPYNWQVIGSFEDLKNATLEDVRKFFQKWYGPNNATLVIAGDFDRAQTQRWVAKYFGELPSPPPVADPRPMPVSLEKTKRAFHEDNFARSPELTMTFPTVPQYHRDAYALELLAELLASGKKAPLYKVIVEEKKLAPAVSANQRSMEIAGYFQCRVRTFPDKNLTEVEKAIHEAFARFEQEKFTAQDLARIKAKIETDFYNGIASILSKAFQLATYNELAGSPDFLTQDIQNSLAVTTEDIWRVYHQYLKNKPYVLTSFVPKGKVELVAENSERFPVVEEAITEAKPATPEAAAAAVPAEKLPSSFDRSVEPPAGPPPALTLPKIWTHTYKNGLRLYGIEHKELPLVDFSLTLKGGLLLDDPGRVGVANLITDLMMEGTKNKTPLELQEAIEALGATIQMYTTDETIVIQANTLASKLEQTYALFEEMLLEPRWDEKEFARLKQETLETINRRNVDPASVAEKVHRKLIYGPRHILSHTTLGEPAMVEQITVADLKAFYQRNYSPTVAHIAVVGNLSRDRAIKLFAPLEQKWPAKEVRFPDYPLPPAVEKARLYFVDMPSAKQSQIRIGYLALPFTHPDYYAATVMNYKLGGSFNGVLNLILREQKGYTYGARSAFLGSLVPGPFVASAGVRSNATQESVQIFKDEMAKYRQGISQEDFAFTRNALLNANALRFETLGALRGMLDQIALYGLPFDYIKQREKMLAEMSPARHQALARQYIDPERMIYLVVGDAATQLEGLKQLGLGDPILLDKDGNPVN
ncbi:MAG: insulinase family protein [candidate division KSB1 bacterium]|nr:insulinase family protein [candidate division KSB1 bacterium]MDZ7272931.1 insulinase family protein [candidate division KSB1 bacterium]MDZ7284047.1 insulinase family protein [candidate division KSB1 bacterium]MDZ7297556.1 insulinase family protein [candidate division KSB1 bacterium]MDZ7308922.1 insulinase family protein [candidate division KSB1 bacterium]